MIPTPKGVGDLTVQGWVVFLAYFGAAALCYRAAASCWRDPGASSRLFRVWITLSAILVLLGVNKQLDFHVWLNVFGRQLAESEGWYQNRWIAQVTFFGGFAVVVLTVCLVLIWLGWGNLRSLSGALLGMAGLAAFLLIRAISFDVLDLRTYVGGIKLHELLEMAGLLLIGVSATLYATRTRSVGAP
ncbi:MAG: hypothetical protein WBO53_19315 [Thermoanaerobaculia bacterium]